MMLRNIAFAFVVVLSVLFIRQDEARAGGDMSAGPPYGYANVERQSNSRHYYRAPYGSDFGDAYGRNYVFGSYYRAYRTHYYSYSYPNYYTRYYPRRRYIRRVYRAPGYRAPYSSYSYRYR